MPVPLTTVAPAASATQTAAGTLSLRAKFKVLVDNIAYLFTNKANLASPALSGTPTAPTAAAGTNNTQVATTAFVTTARTTADTNIVNRIKRTNGVTVGFDSNSCDFNVNSYASADLAVQAAVNSVANNSTIILQAGVYTFKNAVNITNKDNITIRG